ncbi:ribosome-recycling factor [Clostridia bacterium]|nr:ribosome-recycling factor [Clostridia bacterium]
MDEMKTIEEKMKKACESLKNEYLTIRAGRANPHLLDKLQVDYYDTPTPLQQVANVSVPEARMILIQPWDKTLIKGIEKAILASDLGLTPNNDGTAIRLVFPELTQERRKDLAKEIKKKGEAAKVIIRNIRRDGNEMIKKEIKNNNGSEDEQKQKEDKIQKLTDRYIAQLDKMIEEKSTEILNL